MRWIEYVEKVLKYICILLFAALVSIVSFQVLSRLLTQKSFTVIEELSTFLLAWSTFMCAGYAARRHAHVRVEYFVNRFLPPAGPRCSEPDPQHPVFPAHCVHDLRIVRLCFPPDEGQHGRTAVQQGIYVPFLPGGHAVPHSLHS